MNTYKKLVYKDIYPNIDMVLYAIASGLKYEFLVYPGGDPDDIVIQWNGLEKIKKFKKSLSEQAGKIEYFLANGKLTENNLICLQGRSVINSSFIREDNRVSFRIKKYDHSKPLLIDPTLVWGTYFARGNNNGGFNAIANDAFGNVLISGSTYGGILTTFGAYQTAINAGTEEVYVAKFTNKGKILWSTYYGGYGLSFINSLATDVAGNVFVGGYTSGDSGIATGGSFQSSNQVGAVSGFFAKLDSQGFRKWGTYIGNYNSVVTGIAFDKLSGNVYITGGISAQSNNISTAGAYQTLNAGMDDAFLAKFDENGSIAWSTYFGGTNADDASAIAIDNSGYIYIGGTTSSVSGIATMASYQKGLKGAENTFLAKFNSNGYLSWATYYGGSKNDNALNLVIDTADFIYMSGVTSSDSGIATSGAYQSVYASGSSGNNLFISKFSPNGNLLWGTYYHKNTFMNLGTMAISPNGSIFLTGGTNLTESFATNNAFQRYNNGGTDAFLSIFNPAGRLLYATYYGGNRNDAGEGITIDKSGGIYITGYTLSTKDIATSGAFQTSLSDSINSDAFIANFRYAQNDAGISYIQTSSKSLCVGNQLVKVQLSNYGTLPLDSVTIIVSVNGKVYNSYPWKGKLLFDSSAWINIQAGNLISGQDTIRVWTAYPNGVKDSTPGNDSNMFVILVNALPLVNIGQSAYNICTGTHIKIGTNGQPGFGYLWSSVPAGFSSTLPDPVINPGANTMYYLTVTDSITGCTNQNSVNVSVSLLKAPAVNVGKNQSICFGAAVQIGASAAGGNSYSWTSNPAGFVSSFANPIVSPNQTTSYSLTVTSAQGCTNFDSVTITVNPRPIVALDSPLSLCAGLAIHLGKTPIPGYSYTWTSKPSGFNSNLSNPTDSPMVTTTYFLKETITATGCSDSGSVTFNVLPQPAVPKIYIKNTGGFEYRFELKNPDHSVGYSWNFGDSSIMHHALYYDSVMYHTYNTNGTYKITVKAAENQCAAYAYETINVDQGFALNIFPNPFDLQTDIQYTLVKPAHVRISLTDEIGRQMGTLIDKQQEKGAYDLKYDGAAWKSRSGIYFVVFQLDDQIIIRKIIQMDSIYF